MDHHSYAAFLPVEYTTGMVEPTSTWWPWRDMSVHIARAAAPGATVRAMVIHGGGGYSGALWPGAAAAVGEGVEVLAPDLPLYGDTVVPDRASVRYDDWIDLLCDLVRAETAADPRPLVLFGASMGGMLAYEVAARTGTGGQERSDPGSDTGGQERSDPGSDTGGQERSDPGNEPVAAVVATCLLDTSDPAARAAATRVPWLGRAGPALLRAVGPVLGRVRIPIRWLADMRHMSSDPRLSALCAADPRGGGARVPLGFLSSWMNFAHTRPESYAAAPVTLVAPAADLWTPAELSVRFLQRICASTTTVMLTNCGHYPIEEPGLTALRDAMRVVLTEAAPRAS